MHTVCKYRDAVCKYLRMPYNVFVFLRHYCLTLDISMQSLVFTIPQCMYLLYMHSDSSQWVQWSCMLWCVYPLHCMCLWSSLPISCCCNNRSVSWLQPRIYIVLVAYIHTYIFINQQSIIPASYYLFRRRWPVSVLLIVRLTHARRLNTFVTWLINPE